MLVQNLFERGKWGHHMDNLRGQFHDHSEADGYADDYDLGEDETGREPPPAFVGQDERRMQVRAYNYWAGMLKDRNFPSVEDLDPQTETDFGPYSVLLDFSNGIEDPAISFLGDKLAQECGTTGPIHRLSDVPSRSLLSRITDHYLQILANQAPIGFEAEFVNQRGTTILYRGILLPYSSDDDTIDFIYGVINWKEVADQKTADELLLEIDQALDRSAPNKPQDGPLPEWADGPADESHDVLELGLDLAEEAVDEPAAAEEQAVEPAPEIQPAPSDEAAPAQPPFTDEFAGFDDHDDIASPVSDEDAAEMGLADWLASARELADAARSSEERTRHALYAAIGRAYDFYLAANQAPEDFAQLVEDAGLEVQDRAPLTPVVKLVFGIDYDKTRLAEYATVLGHAQRTGLERGSLAEYLSGKHGGLKAVVAEERALRRGESGQDISNRDAPRETLARKLRKLGPKSFDEISAEGGEFTLLVARRLETGEIVLLGEIADDIPLIERAARKLLK